MDIVCDGPSFSVLRVCTVYLPPLDYFAALLEAGRFTVDEEELYRKQTFRNRAFIITSQGPLALSLPCVKPKGNKTPVKEVTVSMKENWARGHWRSLCTAYNRSPYFLYYRDELEDFYNKMSEISVKGKEAEIPLLQVNGFLTDFAVRSLRLPVERVSFRPGSDSSELSLKETLSHAENTGRLVDFSPKDKPKYRFDSYLQTFPCAMPEGHRSILDLLFNLGPEGLCILRSASKLS